MNLCFFPQLAGSLYLKHMAQTTRTLRLAIEWLYSDVQLDVDAATLQSRLLSDMQTASQLLAQARNEVILQQATWEELSALNHAHRNVSYMLSTCVTERRWNQSLAGNLSTLVRKPASLYLNACTRLLTDVESQLIGKASNSVHGTDSPLEVSRVCWTESSAQLSEIVIESLKSITTSSLGTHIQLDSATHCISMATPLATELDTLAQRIKSFASRPRTVQFRMFGRLHAEIQAMCRWRIRNPLGNALFQHDPFLPTPSIAQRLVLLIATHQAIHALKVTSALLCLLAILWAPQSRQWFLDNTITSATVPLILALMPTLGKNKATLTDYYSLMVV